VKADLSPHPWPARRAALDLWLAFGLYALLAYVSIQVARQPGSIATIWLANGAAVALIVSAPRQRTLALLAASAAGNLAANLAYGDPLTLSAAFLPPNTAEIALGCYLLRRTRQVDRFSSEINPFLRAMVAGALLPPLLGATLGAATLHALGFADFRRVWADWYIGAALGSITMLPLVLALRAGGTEGAARRVFDAVSLAAATAVALTTVLALHVLPYPYVLISAVLLLLAFVRPRLGTFVNAVVFVSTLGVALAVGWYVPPTPNSPLGHSAVYLAALMVVAPAQLVSVVVARQRALGEMLSAVGSRADDIIIFSDMNGVYRWVNQARQAYWGTTAEQVLGRTWAQNGSEASYRDVIAPMFARARAGNVVRRLADVDYSVRGRRTMDMVMQPARDEEGHQIGVIYSGADVTELETSRRETQRMAEQLQASNQSLEQFVRIASHDLREPLNTIAQFCDLIGTSQAGRLDDAGTLYFTQVRSGAMRMRKMLDDVMEFVRLGETALPAAQTVALDDVFAEVVAVLQARIQGSMARVTSGPLGSTHGQPMLLSLVLQNLISNAVKFVPPGRQPMVTVSATRTDGELWLTVADNGIGIDAARVGDLGTPFHRLHARRKYEGSGLGLAISKRIAEVHGGRLDVKSTPDEGSRFSLVMPAG
jgi:PAS domain S-box-containing protein